MAKDPAARYGTAGGLAAEARAVTAPVSAGGADAATTERIELTAARAGAGSSPPAAPAQPVPAPSYPAPSHPAPSWPPPGSGPAPQPANGPAAPPEPAPPESAAAGDQPPHSPVGRRVPARLVAGIVLGALAHLLILRAVEFETGLLFWQLSGTVFGTLATCNLRPRTWGSGRTTTLVVIAVPVVFTAVFLTGLVLGLGGWDSGPLLATLAVYAVWALTFYGRRALAGPG